MDFIINNILTETTAIFVAAATLLITARQLALNVCVSRARFIVDLSNSICETTKTLLTKLESEGNRDAVRLDEDEELEAARSMIRFFEVVKKTLDRGVIKKEEVFHHFCNRLFRVAHNQDIQDKLLVKNVDGERLPDLRFLPFYALYYEMLCYVDKTHKMLEKSEGLRRTYPVIRANERPLEECFDSETYLQAIRIYYNSFYHKFFAFKFLFNGRIFLKLEKVHAKKLVKLKYLMAMDATRCEESR